MSKKKSKILLFCISFLVLIGVCSIFAVMVDSDEAVNDFTIGNVNISLIENDTNYTEDEIWSIGSDRKYTSNLSGNIISNGEVSKAPKVENIGNNPAYIYLKVTVPVEDVTLQDDSGNELNNGAKVATQLFTFQYNGSSGINSSCWTLLPNTSVTYGGKATYIYYYTNSNATIANSLLPGETTGVLFDSVKFANLADLNEIYGSEDIDIKAYAVQAKNAPNITALSNAFVTKWENFADDPYGVQTFYLADGTPVEVTSKNSGNYYGAVVRNYTQGGKTYQLYYIDWENKYGDGYGTVYLKAKWTADDTTLSSHISYTPDNELDRKVIRNMNPQWALDRFSTDIVAWNANESAAAWLCSPSQWTSYKDTTGVLKDYVNYSIGAPSVEMYCDSYNEAFGKVQDSTTGTGVIATRYYSTTPAEYPVGVYDDSNGAKPSVPGYAFCDASRDSRTNANYVCSWYRYTIGGSTSGYERLSIDKQGMYCVSSHYMWLASPSAYNTNRVCHVLGGNLYLDNYNYGGTLGVCPLVSLKSGVPLEF